MAGNPGGQGVCREVKDDRSTGPRPGERPVLRQEWRDLHIKDSGAMVWEAKASQKPLPSMCIGVETIRCRIPPPSG